MSAYPSLICAPCGKLYGRVQHNDRCATFHEPDPNDVHDICGWCGTRALPLTEPRDYGYPQQVLR